MEDELEKIREFNKRLVKWGYMKKDSSYPNEPPNKKGSDNVIGQSDLASDEIELPRPNRLVSEFADDLGHMITDTNEVFFRVDSRDIVEIGRVAYDEDNIEYTGFISIEPSRFITVIENHVIPVKLIKKKNSDSFEKKKVSIKADLAKTVLCSDAFQCLLPKIKRIFSVPIPIFYKGELTFPKPGYDKRFYSWLPLNAPKINPEMSLEEAKKILDFLFSEFAFEDEIKDKANAIAGLLTPFLRGLYSSFNVRTPAFFYLANRERAGKDYLAGITGIVYEGQALEDSPVSSGNDDKGYNNEELRKKILSAMISGRKRIHFSNNKGFINNSVLEQLITNQVYCDRILGKSEVMIFDNELEITLSGNTGITYTPDFSNRCIFIRLFLEIEDANARTFNTPNLHEIILSKRSEILSALYTLVRNWIENGKKPGSKPFASFHEWASVCGGILEEAGYGNPCDITNNPIEIGGDRDTEDMKVLFENMYLSNPEKPITASEIKDWVKENDVGIFIDINFNERKDQTKFGTSLVKFTGRILSDIRMDCLNGKDRAARREYRFTKVLEKPQRKLGDYSKSTVNIEEVFGNHGNFGNIPPSSNENDIINNKTINKVAEGEVLPLLPMLPNNDPETRTQKLLSKLGMREIEDFSFITMIKGEFQVDEDKAWNIFEDLKNKSLIFSPHPGWLKRV